MTKDELLSKLAAFNFVETTITSYRRIDSMIVKQRTITCEVQTFTNSDGDVKFNYKQRHTPNNIEKYKALAERWKQKREQLESTHK